MTSGRRRIFSLGAALAAALLAACGSSGASRVSVKGTTVEHVRTVDPDSTTTSSRPEDDPGPDRDPSPAPRRHDKKRRHPGGSTTSTTTTGPGRSTTATTHTDPPPPPPPPPHAPTTRTVIGSVWGADGIFRVGPGGAGCSLANAVHSAGDSPHVIISDLHAGDVVTVSAGGQINTGLRNTVNSVPPDGATVTDAVNTNYPPETSINVSAANGLSGISGPNVGFLVGVFTGTGGTRTDTNGSTYSYPYHPAVNQVFFVGDGNAYTQPIVVPAGATKLALGLADAWDSSTKVVKGCPDFYDDNSSPSWRPELHFSVSVKITTP